MNTKEKLSKKRVAMLLEDGFNKDEYDFVREMAEGAGAHVDVVSSGNLEVTPYGESNANRSKPVQVDSSHTEQSTYDGLVIISGVMDHSKMAENEEIRSFIDREFEAHTPIVAIGSGEQVLEKTSVFEAISSPVDGDESENIVRSQSVMYVKDLGDKKTFSDEFIDFLSQT